MTLVDRKSGRTISFLFLVLSGLVLFLQEPAQADNSPFGYIYSSDMLPKGQWEYEQWQTVRTGKAAGSYTSVDLRSEFEYGFGEDFSASFYINSSYLYTKNVPSPDDPAANLKDQSSFNVNGASIELKKRLLNAEKDPFGLLLYLEPEMSARSQLTGEDVAERALEFRVVADKFFFDDKLIVATNLVFEPEWEHEEGELVKELKTEYSLGASLRLAPRWQAGLELLNRRIYEDQNTSRQIASAYFLGPTVHYTEKSWWTTLTVLPQIGGVPNQLGTDTNGNSVGDSSRTLAEFEKLEVRLRFGIDFQ